MSCASSYPMILEPGLWGIAERVAPKEATLRQSLFTWAPVPRRAFGANLVGVSLALVFVNSGCATAPPASTGRTTEPRRTPPAERAVELKKGMTIEEVDPGPFAASEMRPLCQGRGIELRGKHGSRTIVYNFDRDCRLESWKVITGK